jgi:hypothetical protein
MLYSRWRPHSGDYEYFESSEQVPLADDLPVPKLLGGTAIGVSSLVAGRKMPSGSVYRGTGPHARGMIVPSGASSSGLGLLNLIEYIPGWGWLAIGLSTGWYLWGRKKSS